MTENDELKNSDPENVAGKKSFPTKLALFALFAICVGTVYFLLRDYVDLKYLASIESDLKSFRDEHYILTFFIAFAVYVIVTACSLPIATVLSLLFAWFFGFAESLVLISFASSAGATLAFIMSRYFFRGAAQKMFGSRFDQFNEHFQSEGPFFLFSLRLIPVAPFFVVNVIMALTTIKTRTFWWVSQLGMLPGTAVYCFLGSQFKSLNSISEEGVSVSPWLIVAFATLGIFPLVVRLIVKRLRPSNATKTIEKL